jgi:hypothetical protein
MMLPVRAVPKEPGRRSRTDRDQPPGTGTDSSLGYRRLGTPTYREAVAGVITFRGATRKITRPWGPIGIW